MLNRDDLIDAIVRHFPRASSKSAAGGAPRAAGRWIPEGPKGRPFLTERELKRRLAPGGSEIAVPADAILSPLATDWLILNRIRVKIKG